MCNAAVDATPIGPDDDDNDDRRAEAVFFRSSLFFFLSSSRLRPLSILIANAKIIKRDTRESLAVRNVSTRWKKRLARSSLLTCVDHFLCGFFVLLIEK